MATIGDVLAGIVIVRAENVVGAEIETLGSRIDSTRRSRRHNSEDRECNKVYKELGFLEREKNGRKTMGRERILFRLFLKNESFVIINEKNFAAREQEKKIKSIINIFMHI